MCTRSVAATERAHYRFGAEATGPLCQRRAQYIYIYRYLIFNVSSEKVKEPFNLSFLNITVCIHRHHIYLRYNHC
jgi:hypothetical protein